MTRRDTIWIKGLEVTCRIGAGEEERAVPQVLRLDIAMVPGRGLHGLDDKLDGTVDYHAVALAVRALAASKPRCLVETLAEETLELLREQFAVMVAEVTVRKYILPFAEWVGVTLASLQSMEQPAGAAALQPDNA